MTFLCIGHRGASGHAPENTLKAFELAIDMGCPWIELDVYFVDGELVVIHDDDVRRTTNGRGLVMELGFSRLRELDAGGGQQIPTLKEVLDLCDKRVSVNVELKGPDTAEPVSELLRAALTDGWQTDQFMISSFYHDELAKADPQFPRGALFHKAANYLEKATELSATSINLAQRLAIRETIEFLHKRDFRVLVYTVNTRKEMQAMKNIGADGVFTNYPNLFPRD
jgi:glycerophosphoryl diester phosphodiesterase